MKINKEKLIIGNPYNGILNIIKQQNNSSSSAVVIGKVVNTNPLFISIGELFLDREDLMVNENIKSFNFNTGQLTDKILEGKAALKIWIYKAVLTKRYVYPIYSWDYGQDLEELIGRGYDTDFIKSEVERRVQECLIINDTSKDALALI